MKTSRKFGREAREGAGIYPRRLLSSLPLPRTMAPDAQRMRRRIISHSPKRSSASPSLHTSVIVLGKQYTDVGCSLAPWLNQTLQVEAVQQSGTLQCRHWCGNSWKRVALPGCGLGRHAVSRAKPNSHAAMVSSEGCAMPFGAIATQTSSVISILQHHPTSDGASQLSHMAAAWHGTRAH